MCLSNFLTQYIYYKFLRNFKKIIEFGCGTAKNLYLINKLSDNHELIGTDWALPSIQIINEINKSQNSSIQGFQFNMMNLDGLQNIPNLNQSAVFTYASLEQLGENWHAFINVLIKKKSRIIVHIEPIEEFYSNSNIFDITALLYHRQRNYLSGYFTYLQKLENEEKIQIQFSQRMYLGSEKHEGYSLLVWTINDHYSHSI